MKPRTAIRPISTSRWLAYATASATTVLAGASVADAGIHYSGLLKHPFPGNPAGSLVSFPLNNGASLRFERFPLGTDAGIARLEIVGPDGRAGDSVGEIAGNFVLYGGFYISNLASRVNVSKLPMGAYCRQTSSGTEFHCFGGTIGYGDAPRGQFQRPGVGFIAFSFDTGAGKQYGWARIKTDGAPTYRYILLDYAWADPGEKIRTGQKGRTRQSSTVPVKGSLGLLALGGAGLLGWRKQRGNAITQP